MRKPRSEIETELKISLSRDDLERVFQAFSQKNSSSRIEHKFLPRAYYDTDDLALHAAGLSLRVQYKPGKGGKIGGYEQTVKFEFNDVAKDRLLEGAVRRKECKNALQDNHPDIGAIADAEAALAFKSFKNRKLKHIFTAAIERRYFNMPVGKSVVEVAFDVGDVILQPDGKSHSFCEIEIELKAGNPASIGTVLDKILKIAPDAKIQPLSKSQQGTMLYARQRRKP